MYVINPLKKSFEDYYYFSSQKHHFIQNEGLPCFLRGILSLETPVLVRGGYNARFAANFVELRSLRSSYDTKFDDKSESCCF